MITRPDPISFDTRSLNIDEPFIRQTGTGNEHYHTDALGSSLALSNVAGIAAVTYTYEPFGKTVATETSTNSLQYTGRENDGTGLYYYRARYYSPVFQRFLSEDPIGLDSGDANFYGYVVNNPTNTIDPSGEIIPLLIATCGRGAFQSISQDIAISLLSGRKPQIDWYEAGKACLTGGLNKFQAVGKASSAAKKGRAANKLNPDPSAQGPHTTFRRDPNTGQVNHYETWKPQSNPRDPKPWESDKRFDAYGKSHYNNVTGQDVPTPHVHDPGVPGGVRPALPGEIPQ